MSIASDSSALLKFQNTFYDIPKSSVQYIADLPTVISYIIAPVAFYGALQKGRSVPTADLSNNSLRLLTSSQAVEDIANFIRSFSNDSSIQHDSDSKWILIGASYAGALSVWLEKNTQHCFAAHASIAPVVLEPNFWRYSYAVEQAMNFSVVKRCMRGWTRAVRLLDQTISSLQG
ncbi:hypothetical protein BCR33DRAFT_714819, partial [Rhizoclosmatium globosum]